MSFNTCLLGGNVLLTLTIEKIICLPSDISKSGLYFFKGAIPEYSANIAFFHDQTGIRTSVLP
jgi:hypothetical protein